MKLLLKNHVLGHDWALDLLSPAILTENMPQSLLITGMPQLGKATLAHALAMTLICTADAKPCGHCLACKKFKSGNHPDVIILDDVDNNGATLKVEHIRNLQHDLSLKPHSGKYKIALINNFERASIGAANAILKTLEEPPKHVILILTAPSLNQLLPTIISRCQVLTLRAVKTDIIAQILQTKYKVLDSDARRLGQLAQGKPGWAINALRDESILTQREQWLEDLLNLLQKGFATRLIYAQNFVKNHNAPNVTLNLWLSWWRDVLLVNQNSSVKIANVDFEDKIFALANILSFTQITHIINLTQSALKNLNYNVNKRLNMEVLLLNLPQVKL